MKMVMLVRVDVIEGEPSCAEGLELRPNSQCEFGGARRVEP